MAKGFQEHQERMQALSLFGKDLARRSRSRCEICEASGVKLNIYEVPPAPKEPDLAYCVFACDRCVEAMENAKRSMDPEEWRALGNTIWSDIPAVQVAVARLLQRLAPKADWARETLEEAWFDEAIQTWIDAPPNR